MADEARVLVAKVSVRVAVAFAYRALVRYLQSFARYHRISYLPGENLTILLALTHPPTDVVLAARELEAMMRFYQSNGQLRGGAAVKALTSVRHWCRAVGDWVDEDLWCQALTMPLGKVAHNKGAVTRPLGDVVSA